jgi:peroxiredoxin Q/BCP
MEARGFTEHYAEFQAKGVEVIGVSVDPVEAQQRFVQECRIPFPLIADRDKSIARSFGVLGLLGIAQRVTFFIGPDGKVLEVVRGLLPARHVETALARLRTVPPP